MPSILILISLLSWLSLSQADTKEPPLPDDRQPMSIEADSLDIQGEAGKSTYRGHVYLKQGTTEIHGDIVTLLHPNKQFQQAIITGEPARFQRFMTEEQSWLKGRAQKIIYHNEQHTLEFIGNAFISQEGKNEISAPKIFYHLKTQSLQADTTGSQKKQRIQMILTPNQGD